MRIAMIGCGNMGAGMARRLALEHSLFLYDRDLAWTENLAHEVKGKACHTLTEAVQQAEWIILAVKPQNLEDIQVELNASLQPQQVVISVLAGTPLKDLKEMIDAPIIMRMMPNLALAHGEGVIGLLKTKDISDDLKKQSEAVFKSLGEVFWLSESKLDALTALTGSGPAFVFALTEAMIDAGIYMGFTAQEARELVLQMLKGSLTMLRVTKKHPGELQWQVASPGGATIVGLRKFQEDGLRGKLMNTFIATYEKTKQGIK